MGRKGRPLEAHNLIEPGCTHCFCGRTKNRRVQNAFRKLLRIDKTEVPFCLNKEYPPNCLGFKQLPFVSGFLFSGHFQVFADDLFGQGIVQGIEQLG